MPGWGAFIKKSICPFGDASSETIKHIADKTELALSTVQFGAADSKTLPYFTAILNLLFL